MGATNAGQGEDFLPDRTAFEGNPYRSKQQKSLQGMGQSQKSTMHTDSPEETIPWHVRGHKSGVQGLRGAHELAVRKFHTAAASGQR